MDVSGQLSSLLSLSAFVGKSLSDDQTGAAALQPQPRVVPKRPSRDCGTQSDEAPLEPELAEESSKLKMSEAISAATSGGFIVFVKHLTPNYHHHHTNYCSVHVNSPLIFILFDLYGVTRPWIRTD